MDKMYCYIRTSNRSFDFRLSKDLDILGKFVMSDKVELEEEVSSWHVLEYTTCFNSILFTFDKFGCTKPELFTSNNVKGDRIFEKYSQGKENKVITSIESSILGE